MTLYFYLAKITLRVIRKPKSDFVEKCLPLVPVPSQLNPIESITSYASIMHYLYAHFVHA